MKKNDLRLLLVFGVLLLLFALAGCTPAEQGTGETTEQKTQESTAQTTESEITTETTERTTAETTEKTAESEETIETETEEIVEKNFGLENDLVLELIDYLQNLRASYDMRDGSFATKLRDIEYGRQAWLATFDSSEYYYACAYYNATHELETNFYCCAKEYTWIKFENANEIPEYYNGEKFIKAFQINKALSCQNILLNEPEIEMEHYQIYEPTFQNDLNIASPTTFKDSFIYLDPNEHTATKKLYCSKDSLPHSYNSFHCVILDGQCYVTVVLKIEKPDGRYTEKDLHAGFAEYYDDLSKVMITVEYSEENEKGHIYHYAFIKFEDLVDIILK